MSTKHTSPLLSASVGLTAYSTWWLCSVASDVGQTSEPVFVTWGHVFGVAVFIATPAVFGAVIGWCAARGGKQ